ncbi:hypothetical protein HDA32_002936 [Spinactinospora alkalitolerans]|uniref:DUF2795 domain-containing protein n=1 Tax=Spinactinospora alkalitolerans TaxID=687207 RepID=A0A852TTP4_9ACTN|nr:DUF2795 domain-containing protein [Spinactinospora alkalitolerans]NYE47816.1 hypothetical protein [Spinactinospora alkalitolerans]
MAVLHDVNEVKRALSDLDYPADKERVVACAERNAASEEALRALRTLPLGDYANEAEVLRSLPVDPAAPEERTRAERARQSRERTRTRPGLAEHMTDTPPSPIEEELGENRES